MNDYLVYLDLPPIPQELLEPFDEIVNKPPKPYSLISAQYKSFQTRLVNDNLADWTKTLFGTNSFVQYQIITRGLDIHKDPGRTVAFNYLLCDGGPTARTCFFDNNKTLVYLEKIQLQKWHRIKTDVFHTVTGLQSHRIAVSVDIKDYTWGSNLPSNV